MSSNTNTQIMKPATAAKKLGIYLPAAPESFQTEPITRAVFLELQSTPPEWLAELRRTGPHPRDVVARKLGVSVSGLARAEITEALTTEQIQELLKTLPAWLVQERATHAEVQAENARVNARNAERRARATDAE
ncbi:DUF5997 family protein [Plantibacter sp. YIM 135249]|jgi:hypothetical protein|uniref:DUF5997 family protein n=1 Tax=Plantibacter sp. YIM 135249 TaxID=3423918 RepID=UPI003D32A09C